MARIATTRLKGEGSGVPNVHRSQMGLSLSTCSAQRLQIILSQVDIGRECVAAQIGLDRYAAIQGAHTPNGNLNQMSWDVLFSFFSERWRLRRRED